MRARAFWRLCGGREKADRRALRQYNKGIKARSGAGSSYILLRACQAATCPKLSGIRGHTFANAQPRKALATTANKVLVISPDNIKLVLPKNPPNHPKVKGKPNGPVRSQQGGSTR